ncbi:hypothetical protein G3M48_008467 [Beauveria asiatica]|uniref:Uncharacterized protein n=1 Tax=Beauveria asiatica TaxID=1069075 RepID=A0AAW0RKL3_9HYPO
MNLRKPTLIANDADNFPSYLVDAGLGTVGIPGTTMLSATIIRKKDVRGGTVKLQYLRAKKSQQCRTDDMVMQVDCWARELADKVPDGTMTVEAAIGLSFLAAETSRAPFRGSFTTVSRRLSVPRASGSSSTSWSRTFEAAAGYDVPELGFWGFAESLCLSDKVQPAPGSAPVTAAEKGTTLMCDT